MLNEKRNLVWFNNFGGGGHQYFCLNAIAFADDEWPFRAADAGLDCGGHYAGLSHSVHLDGYGHAVCVACISQPKSQFGGAANIGFDGAARLFGDV